MSARFGSRSRRGRRAICGALLAPLLVLALSVPAHAEVANHPFMQALISGLQPEPKPLRPKLETPCGVAINPADGTTYVSDYLRRSIIGASLSDFFPGNGPCGLASDGNNLYVNYWHGGVVNPASGVIDPARSTGVAVDPVSKNLYVTHANSIDVYEAPVELGNKPAVEIGGNSLGDGYGVAVSAFPATAGDVYVADAADNTVKVYDPATSLVNPVQTIDGAGTPQGGFVSLVDSSLAIDQSNGELLVVDNTQPGFEHPAAVVDEFNSEGLYRGQLEHALIDGGPVGIAVDESATATNGQVDVTSGNGSSIVVPPELGPPVAEQGALYAFGPAGPGQTLAVTTTGTGQGSVTSTPAGIACPGSCKAELNVGVLVNLAAIPAPGSVFVGWSGGGCSGSGACQLTLSAPTTINAEFAPAPPAPPHSLRAATVEGAGTLLPGPPSPSAAGLRLGKASAQSNGAALLHATLPAPGTLSASGKGLRRAHVSFAQAGPITLHLHLSAGGRRVLKKSKGAHLALRVALSFKPSQAAPASVLSKTVTFKRK